MVISSIIKESIDAILWHHKQGTLLYVKVVAAIIITWLGIKGAFLIPHCKWQTLVLTFVIYCWTILGVVGGAHRMWSHRSYKGSYAYRLLIVAGFIMGEPNSAHEF